MADNTCNGYPNYETYKFSLHLNENDYTLLASSFESVYDFAEHIKQSVEDTLEGFNTLPLLYQDMLNGAVDKVDYRFLAKKFYEIWLEDNVWLKHLSCCYPDNFQGHSGMVFAVPLSHFQDKEALARAIYDEIQASDLGQWDIKLSNDSDLGSIDIELLCELTANSYSLPDLNLLAQLYEDSDSQAYIYLALEYKESGDEVD